MESMLFGRSKCSKAWVPSPRASQGQLIDIAPDNTQVRCIRSTRFLVHMRVCQIKAITVAIRNDDESWHMLGEATSRKNQGWFPKIKPPDLHIGLSIAFVWFSVGIWISSLKLLSRSLRSPDPHRSDMKGPDMFLPAPVARCHVVLRYPRRGQVWFAIGFVSRITWNRPTTLASKKVLICINHNHHDGNIIMDRWCIMAETCS